MASDSPENLGIIKNANKSPPAREVEPIDRFSALIVRGTIIGTGLLGFVLVVRNARMFATYQHVKQIPADYYQLGIKMKGVVQEVTPTGLLRIEHRPDVKWPKILTLKKKPKAPGNLNLRLAGLDISPVGVEHMTKELKIVGRPMTFSVIKPVDKQPDASDADVTTKKAMRSVNLNIELVRKGYARVFGLDNPEHKAALQTNSNYCRLITGLLTCEKVAERRGIGLWERSTWVERLASYPATFVQIIQQSAVTKLLVLTFYLLRDLTLTLYSLAKNLYYIGLAMGSYTVEGYRRFARFIDRLSTWYFGMKDGGRTKAIQQKQ